jgi:hypothetical protein
MTQQTPLWIVMTSTAKMPSSVRSRYRNVALVRLTEAFRELGLRPLMISDRARGVAELRHRGHHFVGKTSASAYQRALAKAQADADALNQAEGSVEAPQPQNAPASA